MNNFNKIRSRTEKKKINFELKEKISIKDAVSGGKTHYFGNKCLRGHTGWRHAHNRSCVYCTRESNRRISNGISAAEVETKKKMDDILFEREMNKITNDEY